MSAELIQLTGQLPVGATGPRIQEIKAKSKNEICVKKRKQQKGKKATDQPVARRQGHLGKVCRVPGAKQDTPFVWPSPGQ